MPQNLNARDAATVQAARLRASLPDIAAAVSPQEGTAFATLVLRMDAMLTGAVFGQKDYAALWGLVSMANVLGQAVAAPLWGLAYDLTGGYRVAMYTSAAVVALAYFVVAWAYKSAQAKQA